MNQVEKGSYIGYEYKELIFNKSQVSFCLDGYANFGWELDERQSELKDSNASGKTIIKLKRNRKILNKAELTRLQRHFEDSIKQLNILEQSKKNLATSCSLIIGILGTAFIAGSTFAVTHEPPFVMLCILLAIPGFIGWITPYFVYKKIVSKKTQKLEPLIEEMQEEIHEICEKGHQLLL